MPAVAILLKFARGLRHFGMLAFAVGVLIVVGSIVIHLIRRAGKRKGAPRTAPAPTTPAGATGQCAAPVALASEFLRILPGCVLLALGIVWLVLWMGMGAPASDPLRERSTLALLAGILWIVLGVVLFLARRRKVACPGCGRGIQHYRVDDGLALECGRCGQVFWPDRPVLTPEQRQGRKAREWAACAGAVLVVVLVVGVTKLTGALAVGKPQARSRPGRRAVPPASRTRHREPTRRVEPPEDPLRELKLCVTQLGGANREARYAAVDRLGAAGQSAEPLVPAIAALLKRRDTDVRMAAIQTLSKLGTRAATAAPALAHALGSDANRYVRSRAARALVAVNPSGEQAVRYLVKALSDGHSDVRHAALAGLGELGPRAAGAGPTLARTLTTDGDPAVRGAAARALAAVDPTGKGTVAHLIGALKNPAQNGRQALISAIGDLGPRAEAAAPALAGILASDADPFTRGAAARALAAVDPTGEQAVPRLLQALKDKHIAVCHAALDALGGYGPRAAAAAPALRGLTAHRDRSIASSARRVLKLVTKK